MIQHRRVHSRILRYRGNIHRFWDRCSVYWTIQSCNVTYTSYRSAYFIPNDSQTRWKSNIKQVWRCEGKPLAYTSLWSRELCLVLRLKFIETRCDYPLLLVGCYMNPLLREIWFTEDTVKCEKYKSKAEDFAQKLLRKQKERGELFSSDGMVPCVSEKSESKAVITNSDGNSSSKTSGAEGNKRTFNLLQCERKTLLLCRLVSVARICSIYAEDGQLLSLISNIGRIWFGQSVFPAKRSTYL